MLQKTKFASSYKRTRLYQEAYALMMLLFERTEPDPDDQYDPPDDGGDPGDSSDGKGGPNPK